MGFDKASIDKVFGPLCKVKCFEIQKWHARIFGCAPEQLSSINFAGFESFTQERSLIFLCCFERLLHALF